MANRLQEAAARLALGQLDGALDALVEGYAHLLAPGSPVARQPIGWAPADRLCRQIGERLLPRAELPPPVAWNPCDVYLATQLYAGGGHTAVIGDYVRHSPGSEKVLLLTRTVEAHVHDGGPPPPGVIERTGIDPSQVRLSPAPHSRTATVTWIMEQLAGLRPRRVFCFHHPEDAVALAAVQPGLAGAWYMVRHTDRQPSAGVHAEGMGLIDLNPFTAWFTRIVLQRPSLYVPLTVEDIDAKMPPRFLQDASGGLVTVSSASPHKFSPDYPERIARVLRATGGRHVHIGHLPAATRDAIAATLRRGGLDPAACFHYLKWVPSLARAFRDIGADVCVGSAPVGGARTAIEACCAGIPIFPFRRPDVPAFATGIFRPREIDAWSDTEELIEMLTALDRPRLEHLSRLCRAFYEQWHRPELLGEALANLDREGEQRLPPGTAPAPAAFLSPENPLSALDGEWAGLENEFPGLIGLSP